MMPTEHTLAENLIWLQEAKENIADAIVEMDGAQMYTISLNQEYINIIKKLTL